MIKNKYPNYYPMSQVIDGAETITFKGSVGFKFIRFIKCIIKF